MAETEGLDRISEELTGQPPTNSQRKLLLRAMRAVGLRPDDPFLPLFVALGYHQRLYEEIPGKVAAAAKAAAAETRSAAKAVADAATQESLAALTAGVVESAQAIAGNKAATERLQWRSRERGMSTIITMIVLLLIVVAFGAGYLMAQERAEAQQPILAWLASDEGQAVEQARLNGTLKWRLSEEADLARTLSGNGILAWVISDEGKDARALSADGTIEYVLHNTTDRNYWRCSRRGRAWHGTCCSCWPVIGRAGLREKDGDLTAIDTKVVGPDDDSKKFSDGQQRCRGGGVTYWPYVLAD